MKNLTHLQHLKWFIDGVPFGERSSHAQKFTTTLGKVSRPLMSWKDELYAAMSKLVEEHGNRLALFYSGGSDSEVILRVLCDIGVTPEVFTIEFSGEENSHETKHARELCKSLGLKQNVFKHDLEKYIREKFYYETARSYKCSQLAYITVLDYVKRVDIPAIMGGEVYLQKHQKTSDTVYSPSEWYYIYREDEDGMTYRYSQDTGHTLINEVMTYTPELLASWLIHPTIANVANNNVPGKITLLSVKKDVYQEQLGYQLLAQTKFHGYEALTWTNLSVASELKRLWPTQQESRLEYHALLEGMRNGN